MARGVANASLCRYHPLARSLGDCPHEFALFGIARGRVGRDARCARGAAHDQGAGQLLRRRREEDRRVTRGRSDPGAVGEITVNQMYVQYQIPMKGDGHVPVVMVHGCCLSSKTWETTPDGRMGWSEYFVRKDRPVYLADQVSRARSGFDPTTFSEVRNGTTPPAQDADHPRRRRTRSRGPCSASARSSARRSPTNSSRSPLLDELYKQMIPDLNSTLPRDSNPTWKQMAALGREAQGRGADGSLGVGLLPRASRADRSERHPRHRVDRDAVRDDARVDADRDAREDSDSRDVRRPPERRDGRARRAGSSPSRRATRSSTSSRRRAATRR